MGDRGLRLIELRSLPEGVVFHHWEFLQDQPPTGMVTCLLPLANEVYEGYVLTPVCHSVHRGSASVHAGIPPPLEQTPSLGPGTPLRAVHAGRYGQQAGGMHPTGMQSCYYILIAFHSIDNDYVLFWCVSMHVNPS